MKLVYDLRILEPKMHGMARYALELLIAMLEQGGDMRVTALVPDQEAALRLPPDQRLQARICELAPYSPKSQLALPRLLAGLKPDIYHCPFFGPPRFYKGPMLITLHDLIHLKFPRHYGLKQRLYYRLVVGPAARSADRVFTVSRHSKQDLVKMLGVEPDKVVVTYNGVSPGFKPQDEAAKAAAQKELGLPGPYILGLGNPKPHKNLAALVKAHEMLCAAQPEGGIPPPGPGRGQAGGPAGRTGGAFSAPSG